MFCSNNERWLYKLPADYEWQSPYPQQQDWAFADQHGKIRLKLLRDGRIVVVKDYAWDGCTPKFCLFDILLGTPDGDWVSMAVPADGSYGIEPGVIYSFPVRCSGGDYAIVQGLEVSDFSRERMTATDAELREERTAIEGLL